MSGLAKHIRITHQREGDGGWVEMGKRGENGDICISVICNISIIVDSNIYLRYYQNNVSYSLTHVAQSHKERGHWFDSQSGHNAWVAGSPPGQGMYKRQLINVSLNIKVSLPPLLLPLPSL